LRNRLRSGSEVTLADVAQHAGVSESTASRALNGRGELSDRTRQAVLEAARVLQFQPSQLARSLRTATTHTVGFIVPDVSSPFYAAALKGAQGALEQAGYRVLLMDSAQSAEREVVSLRTLLAHRVDGLLVSTVGMGHDQFEHAVGRRVVPLVFFDSMIPGEGEGTVLLDNQDGIALLVDHLVQHGHRRIALLAGSREETSGSERAEAFADAMRRHGLPCTDDDIVGEQWLDAAGRVASLQLLARHDPPTALVASSVELALGALAACRELGRRIPDDVALVTFDDAYFNELLEPPLTAIAYDPAEVGRRAAALLVEAMRDEGDQHEPRHVTIPVRLVARRSCGCTT
jgi:DNA-binding LacI/PurR family transcriptional regulator